jgi:AcrR family transcriptional regulator
VHTAPAGAPAAPQFGGLTPRQAERRAAVIRAAHALAAAGGYDAVQMRDVSNEAGVALGTIYRYFTSKDQLLAAVMAEWMLDLDRRVSTKPPSGRTTAERVVDVLGRALRGMAREPKLAAAVVAAMTSADPDVGRAQIAITDVANQIMAGAFDDEADAAVVSKIIAHVWFSALIAWTNGVGDMDWVLGEIRVAAERLCP